MKNLAIVFIYLLTLISCATEKPIMSPIVSTFSNVSTSSQEVSSKVNKSIATNANASELTNICATFPKYKNELLNVEIINLKKNIQNYIYSLESSNFSAKNSELKKVKQSYINIQKQSKSLQKL
jgi:cytochrome c